MPEVLDWQRADPCDAELVKRFKCVIVFICTGNTCRSPLAEGLCKKLLADAMVCSPAQLPERGIQVLSAGLAAISGAEATHEAVAVASEYGVDLSGHLSRPVTDELIQHANYVVAMTRSHLRILECLQVPEGPAPRLLATDGAEIPDPIGGQQEEYRACAKQIYLALKQFVPLLQRNGDLPNPSTGVNG